MALMNTEIGKCKSCGLYGQMIFINHKQSQEYCDLCKPKMKQKRIHDAVITLMTEGVTRTQIKKLIAKIDKP